MRYYLDTNILIFILQNEKDNIHFDIKEILADYTNTLLVSSIVMQELFLLFRIGKLSGKTSYKNESDYISALKNLNIKIVFFNEHHFSEYSKLQIADSHKDMNDHLIISQAMSDKIPLISSDGKFKEYIPQGLDFVFNKR